MDQAAAAKGTGGASVVVMTQRIKLKMVPPGPLKSLITGAGLLPALCDHWQWGRAWHYMCGIHRPPCTAGLPPAAIIPAGPILAASARNLQDLCLHHNGIAPASSASFKQAAAAAASAAPAQAPAT